MPMIGVSQNQLGDTWRGTGSAALEEEKRRGDGSEAGRTEGLAF